MNYAIGAAAALCCFFLSGTALDREKIHRSKYLRPRCPEEEDGALRLTGRQIRAISALITLLAAATAWKLTGRVQDTLNYLKLTAALTILSGCACVDLVEHRIPNFLTGLLALLSALFLSAGFLTGQPGALGCLNSSLFSAAASAAVLTVGSLLSHQGIGMGDVKLIVALGLAGGVYVTVGTVFFAALLCALASGWLLLSGRKTLKESIPFGPFLLIGYMLTLWVLKF